MHKLGIKTVLVRTGYGKKNEEKVKESGLDSIIVNNISDFADYIENCIEKTLGK